MVDILFSVSLVPIRNVSVCVRVCVSRLNSEPQKKTVIKTNHFLTASQARFTQRPSSPIVFTAVALTFELIAVVFSQIAQFLYTTLSSFHTRRNGTTIQQPA